jgi:hypothetical protein
VFFVFCACTDEQEIKKALTGTWSIDSYAPSNEFIFMNFYSNMIIFESNGTCRLPRPQTNRNQEGKWLIFKNEQMYYVTFDVPENDLSGKYQIIFDKDHANKLLKLYLISDSNTIICSKGMLFLKEFYMTEIPKSCEVKTAKDDL